MISWLRRVFGTKRPTVAEQGEDRVTAGEVTATVSAIVERVWQQREAVQATGSDPGDWGRLAAAFAELERSGWVARMDFTCCQTCGHAEIGDERSRGEHSYVFFHTQDTEHLADPGPSLYFSYSYFETHPGVDRLRRHGLGVEWDGSHQTGPFLALRDWRKPLPVGS